MIKKVVYTVCIYNFKRLYLKNKEYKQNTRKNSYKNKYFFIYCHLAVTLIIFSDECKRSLLQEIVGKRGGKAALMQSLLLPDSKKSVKKLLEKLSRIIVVQIASFFHVYPYIHPEVYT